MKKHLIFFSFFLLNLEVIGQVGLIKPKVLWGAEFIQNSMIEEVIENDSAGLYLVMKHIDEKSMLKKNIYTLEHRDYSLQLLNIRPFSYVQAGKKVEFFCSLGGITYIISSELNELKNKVELFVQTLNRNSLQFNVDIRKLTEFEMPSDNPFSYTFHMTSNRDKTRHLLTCMVYDSSFKVNVSILGRSLIGEGERKQFFNFLVLDSGMSAKWELKNQALPQNQILDYQEIMLSNRGNIYVLSSISNDAHKNGINARNYSINCFNENGYQSGLALNMIECYSAELMLKTTESNEVICTGFYSKNFGEAQSTYYLRLDDVTQNVLIENNESLSNSFILKATSEKEKKKKQKLISKGKPIGLDFCRLSNVLDNPDGSCFLIGQEWQRQVSYPSEGAIRTPTIFHQVNDIIVTKLNNRGETIWNDKIDKDQYLLETEAYYSSFALIEIEGQLNFLYNDDSKNLNMKENGKIKTFRANSATAVSMLVEFDTTGSKRQRQVLSTQTKGLIIEPLTYYRLSNKKILLFASKSSLTKTRYNGRLGILSF